MKFIIEFLNIKMVSLPWVLIIHRKGAENAKKDSK